MKNPIPKNKHEIYNPFIYPIISKVKLEKKFKELNKDFLSVYYDRKSSREFKNLPRKKLSELLYHSNRIKSFKFNNQGYFETSRTSPSAGGRHPIDILVFTPSLSSCKEGYYYNPFEHSLGKIKLLKKDVISFIEEVDENLPIMNGSLLWFVINTEKTQSKYLNPESLYWKDLGALIYNIQIVCSYLNLVNCPIGTLASNNFHKLFDNKKLISGGGIVIGS